MAATQSAQTRCKLTQKTFLYTDFANKKFSICRYSYLIKIITSWLAYDSMNVQICIIYVKYNQRVGIE